MSESTYLTLARPSQICTAGSSAAVVGGSVGISAMGLSLWRAKQSGKIGSFFKVWSIAFRRVSSQTFAGSQNLPITLPWSFRNFSDLGSNVPQLSKLFFIWRFEEAYDWVSGGLDPKAAKSGWKYVKFKQRRLDRGLSDLYTAAVNATTPAEPRRDRESTPWNSNHKFGWLNASQAIGLVRFIDVY